MLKIQILSIGKDKDRWISEGCDHYLKLLSRYAKAEIKLLPSVKTSSALSASEVKSKEADRLLPAIGSSFVVALHDRGKTFDSMAFARQLEQLQMVSAGKLTFVVGGAFGLHERVLKKAKLQLSLSALTLSHQLARLTLLEQLYRGFSILHGTSYHK